MERLLGRDAAELQGTELSTRHLVDYEPSRFGYFQQVLHGERDV